MKKSADCYWWTKEGTFKNHRLTIGEAQSQSKGRPVLGREEERRGGGGGGCGNGFLSCDGI